MLYISYILLFFTTFLISSPGGSDNDEESGSEYSNPDHYDFCDDSIPTHQGARGPVLIRLVDTEGKRLAQKDKHGNHVIDPINGEPIVVPEFLLDRNATFEQLNQRVRKILSDANITLPELPWENYRIRKELLPRFNIQAIHMRLPGQFDGFATFDDVNLCFNPESDPSELPEELRIRPGIFIEDFNKKMATHADMETAGNPKAGYCPLIINMIRTPALQNVSADELRRTMDKNPLLAVDDEGKLRGILILQKERQQADIQHGSYYATTAFPGITNVDFHKMAKVIHIVETYLKDNGRLDRYKAFLEVFYATGIMKDISLAEFMRVYMNTHGHIDIFHKLPKSVFQQLQEQNLILDEDRFLIYKQLFATHPDGCSNLNNIWRKFLNIEGDVDLNCVNHFSCHKPYCTSIDDLRQILLILLHLSERGIGFRFQGTADENEIELDYSAPPRTVRLDKTATGRISVIVVVANVPPDATSGNVLKTVRCTRSLQPLTLDNIDQIL